MNYILSQSLGNNALSYNLRKQMGSDTTLVVSDICEITSLDQVQLGDFVVFEEVDNGSLYSCTGLAQTYILHTNEPNSTQLSHSSQGQCIIITDNHNHVLPHWLDICVKHQTSSPQLIHIDQHSDLGPNTNTLNIQQLGNPNYHRDFAHLNCNIGNFITPCIESKLINNMIQIRTEYSLQAESGKRITKLLPQISKPPPLILDIDLDFRAPEMGISNINQTMEQVRHIMNHADLITIATSPYFIDQQFALELLHQLLAPRLAK